MLLVLGSPLADPPLYARGPDPPLRVALETFGFQSVSARYLLEGATMLTLDYVDSRHLLFTFGVSKLMPRLPDCPEDDEDRTVDAVLIELPSGREVARTEWRFHDLGQYLWNLGEGQFLLRRRDVLSTFDPIQQLASGKPFAEQPFLHMDRRIEAIVVSANQDLISIESIKRTPPAQQALAVAQAVPQANSQSLPPPVRTTGLKRRDPNAPKSDAPVPAVNPTEITFIRLLRVPMASKPVLDNDPAGHSSLSQDSTAAARPVRLLGRVDGRIYTPTAVNVPLTTEGFLRARTATNNGVLLDFLTFTGKDLDLGDFATSCAPRPTFVSRSEFVVFGCRGTDQSVDLAGFNLKGDFLWQINFPNDQAYPSFVSSIPAGRFALSRTVTSTHVFETETPAMAQLEEQEVRVVQMYNGKQLFRAVTSPIQRAGQNFSLSPDGLSLAVVRDYPILKGDITVHHTWIEVYKLPPVSEADATQIKLEAAMAPAPSDVHMRFSPEEIKAALAAKPNTDEAPPPSKATSVAPSDSHIVGDPIPQPVASSATPSSGTIPMSDLAPACATLTTASATAPAACPVVPQPQSKAQSEAQPDASSDPDRRRKPPTLYEPATTDAPASSPK